MRIVSKGEKDGKIYNFPTTFKDAALIPGDFTLDTRFVPVVYHRSIILYKL